MKPVMRRLVTECCLFILVAASIFTAQKFPSRSGITRNPSQSRLSGVPQEALPATWRLGSGAILESVVWGL